MCIGECYRKKKQDADARLWFNKALALEATTPTGQRAHEKARAALAAM
jgi:hypothetical protein